MTALAEGITIEAMPGLIATYEVCDANRRVLGVIAEAGEYDWRVLSTRQGHPEPVRGRHPTREDAAATLIQSRETP